MGSWHRATNNHAHSHSHIWGFWNDQLAGPQMHVSGLLVSPGAALLFGAYELKLACLCAKGETNEFPLYFFFFLWRDWENWKANMIFFFFFFPVRDKVQSKHIIKWEHPVPSAQQSAYSPFASRDNEGNSSPPQPAFSPHSCSSAFENSPNLISFSRLLGLLLCKGGGVEGGQAGLPHRGLVFLISILLVTSDKQGEIELSRVADITQCYRQSSSLTKTQSRCGYANTPRCWASLNKTLQRNNSKVQIVCSVWTSQPDRACWWKNAHLSQTGVY